MVPIFHVQMLHEIGLEIIKIIKICSSGTSLEPGIEIKSIQTSTSLHPVSMDCTSSAEAKCPSPEMNLGAMCFQLTPTILCHG